jgi:hypothetical protein
MMHEGLAEAPAWVTAKMRGAHAGGRS